ncbi:fungal-specific transcription factor domain-containing protein [Scleroderma yunnanense]
MPADTTKSTTLNAARRSSRKFSSSEEIELKRVRGELSCAECRRLKLKCDKKIPCGSCMRRGCPTICPNAGSLSTGQGTRFVLADAEHLHRKIAEMGQRIRQLEDALSILQMNTSNDIHPLLAEDLLTIKYGSESPASRESTGDHHGVPTDASGTLTITDGGESNYFGRSGGVEAGAELGNSEMGLDGFPEDDLPQVSSEVAQLVSVLPIGMAGFSNPERLRQIMDSLFDFLPSYPRATTLCETYLENSAYIFRPISREELIDEILVPVYTFAKERKQVTVEKDTETLPHTLSVLFMVFAHGALTDLTLPPYNSEAENYFHLGRLALSLRSVLDLPTAQTLRAVCLMGCYHSNSGRRYTTDSAWLLISLASKMAQGVSNRDPTRFNLSPKVIQRRRTLFWEIFSADLFHSMSLGRPPSASLSYIDCEFPEDDTATINDKGEIETGFFRWKHSFTKDVFMPVLELTLSAVPPSYDTILDLDRKVREKVLPPSLNLYRSSSSDEYTTPSSYIRGRLLSQFRTQTMLYIHRSFFAQAMLDFPTNPLRSPFAPSFLAAYRCASAIIKTTVVNFQKYPELFTRFWTMWSNLMSAAVIVGTIATRAPSSTMAPAARIELDLALNMFRNGAIQSPRARSGLPILNSLKAKAEQAQAEYLSSKSSSRSNKSTALLPETGGDDELAMFGGQTRILVSKILSRQSRNVRAATSVPSSSTPNSPPPSSDESHSPSESVPEVHPSLVEYLTMLPPPSTSALSMMDAMSTTETNLQPTVESTMATNSPMLTFPENMPSHASSIPPSMPPSGYDQTIALDVSDMTFFDIQQPNSMERTLSGTSDFEFMLTGESGMDARWMSFMRDSGIFGAM